MNARPSLIIGASVILGCLILGSFFGQPSAGQAPPGQANPGDRYQAVPVGNYLVVFDPETGESWARLVQEPQITDSPARAWKALGSPVKKK